MEAAVWALAAADDSESSESMIQRNITDLDYAPQALKVALSKA